jgi:hypothetical protein
VFANQNSRRPPIFGFLGTCPDHVGEVPTESETTSLTLPALRPLRFHHRDEKGVTSHFFRPFVSYTSALFQVPYPLSPLFATLTKTAGVYPNSSHSGTHPSSSTKFVALSFHALMNCPFRKPFVLTFMHRMGGVGGIPNLSTFQPSNVPTVLGLSPFFSHSSKLFCTREKHNSLVFRQFRTLSRKHPGVGVTSFKTSFRSVFYSEAPRGRKYCVPLTGSWRRRSRS